jgi:hypothetical protein
VKLQPKGGTTPTEHLVWRVPSSIPVVDKGFEDAPTNKRVELLWSPRDGLPDLIGNGPVIVTITLRPDRHDFHALDLEPNVNYGTRQTCPTAKFNSEVSVHGRWL